MPNGILILLLIFLVVELDARIVKRWKAEAKRAREVEFALRWPRWPHE